MTKLYREVKKAYIYVKNIPSNIDNVIYIK
jgi:hypothetical protein